MESKTTVIIPVYNEENQLLEHVKNKDFFPALTRWQRQDSFHRRVVFVNDGSTDKTAAIIKSKGFPRINAHKKQRNIGKGGAFATGVRYAYKKGWAKSPNDTLVVLDCDIEGLKPKQITELVEELHSSGKMMAIAKQIENGRVCPIKISGQRAIKLHALQAFTTTSGRKIWEELTRGFRLEVGLNHLIKSKFNANTSFCTAHPYRNTTMATQNAIIDAVEKIIAARKRLVEKLRNIHKNKSVTTARNPVERHKKRQ